MPYKSLLPVWNTNVTAGAPVGWNPTNNANGNSILSNIANTMTLTPGGETIGDHAIPSPIAFLKDFKRRLGDGDYDAVNTWRGMLAVIALQRYLGINITTLPIPVKRTNEGDGNPTELGKIFGKALENNKNITGFENQTKLVCFCIDNRPFAMHIPGMIICPFKEYDSKVFQGVPWFDSNENCFKDLFKLTPAYLAENGHLTEQGKKLYYWLKALTLHPSNNQTAFPSLIDFTAQVLDLDIDKTNFPPQAPAGYAPVVVQNPCNALWQELNQICPAPDWLPDNVWSDMMLVIVPETNHFSGPVTINGERRDYTLFKENKFTPKSFRAADYNYHIVPPVSAAVIAKIAANNLEVIDINCVEEDDGYRYSFTLKKDSVKIPFECVFSNERIVWTADLPYISMWPCANFIRDTWKSHYVAIWPANEQGGSRAAQAAAGGLASRWVKVCGYSSTGASPVIDYKLVCKNSAANVNKHVVTAGTGAAAKDFRVLCGDSQTEALEFSVHMNAQDYSLGCWQIDRNSDAFKNQPQQGQNQITAGLDFGTTSTNLYIWDVPEPARPHSVDSSGEYTGEIFNPYVTQNAESLETDYIQNYYLFSIKKGELGKIFTYARNYSATTNGNPENGFIQFVSGRYLSVDEGFFRLPVNDIRNQSICGNLKWPQNNGNQGNRVITNAANNFLGGAVMLAALQAKLAGATSMDFVVSYPTPDDGRHVIASIAACSNAVQGISGLQIHTNYHTTEARAAGLYYSNSFLCQREVAVNDGFLIVDIGGGTTDVSYCRAVGGNPTDLYFQTSLKYAGVRLVQNSFLRKVDDTAFGQLWLQPNQNHKDAIDEYVNINTGIPVPFLNPDVSLKRGKLEFLLEMATLDQNYIRQNEADLIQTIRIKYLALFYFLGLRIISDQSEQGFLNPLGLTVFMAGCGSKGLDIASMIYDDLSVSLSRMLNGLLQTSCGFPPEYQIEINRALNPNKEEVVLGLFDVPIKLGPQGAGAGAGQGGGMPGMPGMPGVQPPLQNNNPDNGGGAAVNLGFNEADRNQIISLYNNMVEWVIYADPDLTSYYSALRLENYAVQEIFMRRVANCFSEAQGKHDICVLYLLDTIINEL